MTTLKNGVIYDNYYYAIKGVIDLLVQRDESEMECDGLP
jgi:hypothetical protein